jgi:hypothetical protein
MLCQLGPPTAAREQHNAARYDGGYTLRGMHVYACEQTSTANDSLTQHVLPVCKYKGTVRVQLQVMLA